MKIWCFITFAAVIFSFSTAPPPASPEELGELLFHDPILSSDRSVSCASCHIPAFAFADTAVFSRGVGGQLGTRNAPGITNMSARSSYFWDGRVATLEQQVVAPIENEVEMNLPLPVAVDRLRNDTRYSAYFQRVFGQKPDTATLAAALSAFIRTLETGNTPFDHWMKGNEAAMDSAAVRGRILFMKKGKCFDCHFSPDFTGDEFRNIGLYNGLDLNDSGRYAVTQQAADKGKFKVPGLRNVALTAPYMHDGRFKTLREVIDYYDHPDDFKLGSIGRDTLMQRPLLLTELEKSDIEAFLNALTDAQF